VASHTRQGVLATAVTPDTIIRRHIEYATSLIAVRAVTLRHDILRQILPLIRQRQHYHYAIVATRRRHIPPFIAD